MYHFENSNGADNGVSSSKLSKSEAEGEGPSSNPPVKLKGDKLFMFRSSLSPPVRNSISVSPDGEA